jgi:hypothetical protein
MRVEIQTRTQISISSVVNSHLDVIIEEFLGLELLLAVGTLEVPDPLVEILKHRFTYTLAATSLDRKHSSKPTANLNNA